MQDVSSSGTVWTVRSPFNSSGFDLDAVGVIHQKTLLADFNSDGIVDLSDYSIFAAAYLSEPNDENWNQHCDISEPPDEFIDMLDFISFSNEWLITEQWYLP